MKKYTLPKEFGEKWIAALRSGEYKQDTENSTLRHDGCYCVVGVAAIANNLEFKNDNRAVLNDGTDIIKFIGKFLFRELYNLNDHDEKSFPEIADWIEQNVELC